MFSQAESCLFLREQCFQPCRPWRNPDQKCCCWPAAQVIARWQAQALAQETSSCAECLMWAWEMLPSREGRACVAQCRCCGVPLYGASQSRICRDAAQPQREALKEVGDLSLCVWSLYGLWFTPGFCPCSISSGQVRLMMSAKPSLLCVHLCSGLQSTGPMWLLDSHQSAGPVWGWWLGPWHCQPGSLVGELALQVCPGQWKESHLHVGLLFSPCLSVW